MLIFVGCATFTSLSSESISSFQMPVLQFLLLGKTDLMANSEMFLQTVEITQRPLASYLSKE